MSGKRAALLGALLALAAALPVLVSAQEAEWSISNPTVFGKGSRPAVRFTHAGHIRMSPGATGMEGSTCLTCHHTGDPSQGCATCHAKPLELETSYHLLCIGCHDTARKKVGVTGPRACGECHALVK